MAYYSQRAEDACFDRDCRSNADERGCLASTTAIQTSSSSVTRQTEHAKKSSARCLQLTYDTRTRYAFFNFYVFEVSQFNDTIASLFKLAIPGRHLTECVDTASLAFWVTTIDMNPFYILPTSNASRHFDSTGLYKIRNLP